MNGSQPLIDDQPRDDQPRDNQPSTEPTEATRKSPWRFSLREYLALATIAMLTIGLLTTASQLSSANQELARLRAETGYLAQTEPGQIAAARAPSDQPLTYRARIRVPESRSAGRFRLAYSSLWPRKAAAPKWFGAIPVPPGESVVTLKILEDPRDGLWKISALIGSNGGVQRMSTVLPEEHLEIFRGSHDVISTGIPRAETFSADQDASIRILDERWLVGEGSLMLYGDRPPERDQIGIYAELQPDSGTLQ